MNITETIFNVSRSAAGLVASVLRGAVRLISLNGLVDRLADKLSQIPMGLADAYFAGSKSDLLAGRLEAYAESVWPKVKWPTAWKEIPEDIRRPVVWDGRLLAGIDVSWLANKHITDEAVANFSARSMRFALKFWLFSVVIVSLYLVSGQLGMLSSPWLIDGTEFPSWAWSVDKMALVKYVFGASVNSVYNLVGFAWAAIMIPLKVGALLSPIAFAAYVAGFTRNLRAWWDDASEAFRTPTRDALLIWKSRADHRENEYRAYCRQVDSAIGRLKDEPVIELGRGTGLLRSRGDMQAPKAKQVMAFDGESLRQHLLVLGGTGEGKTRLVLKPLFERIMTAKWGEKTIGCYVSDGKNSLWKSLVPVLVKAGREVKIIGTGPEHYGLDLVAGMTPLEISTTFKAVSSQVLGGAGDDFWPESASLLIMHAAILARAINAEPAMVTRFEASNCKPFSLSGIARIAVDDKVQSDVLKHIEARFADASSVLTQDELAAIDSIEFIRNTWADLAAQTKSGIVANVNSLLGKLAGAPAISSRFCSGLFDKTIDVDYALNGGCVLIALGDEGGSAARLATVWLKSRLFVLAKQRLLRDPDAAASNSTLMMVDEAQDLITTGPDSEASFMNIARETGVFMVYATQSLAALEKVMPADLVANMVNLFRSKIILKTEEAKTLDLQQKLAGTLPRGWEASEHLFATQGLREFMKPDSPAPEMKTRMFRSLALIGNWNPLPLTIQEGANVITRLNPKNANRLFQTPIQKAEDITKWMVGNRGNSASKEDLTAITWRPVIETSEFLVGGGMAFATIQRAGLSRSDLIDLVEEETA